MNRTVLWLIAVAYAAARSAETGIPELVDMKFEMGHKPKACIRFYVRRVVLRPIGNQKPKLYAWLYVRGVVAIVDRMK